MNAAEQRSTKIRRLSDEPFDLLVIGGGINGAGVAREAALRGLKTALVDKGDFGGGTSSRSSKLVHGGFRYLETGDFGLVLEASRERDLLRRRLAPHLVAPLRFFFPVYRDGPVPLWKLRCGLLLYDLLAAFRNIERHRIVHAARAHETEPGLRTEGLRGGALYYDCFTDDARLVLENVLGAEQAGAVCVNYVGVEALEKDDHGRLSGARVRDLDRDGVSLAVRARVIVNATGPWLDRVRALDDPRAVPILRPTKGVHVVVRRERVGNRHAIVLHAVRDGRLIFVIPWQEHTIVGTTDTDYEGSPDDLAADASDVDYLLETVNVHFPRAHLKERDVVSTFAGLRPLVAGTQAEAPSEVSREEALFESGSGLISVGGGKLTTYRRVAVKVVDRVGRELRRRFGIETSRRSGTEWLPLPGGATAAIGAEPCVATEVAEFLRRRYGARAPELLSLVATTPGLAERLAPEAADMRAEVAFAAEFEMALRVDDVLRRRTHVALKSAGGGAAVAEMTSDLMGERLGWSRPKREQRAREYVERAVGPLRQARRQA
ncbi:MAG TPA: glycerol-3-phosphate dehydrogenase [Candidatus Binatia bacterium]|nr:glycerol-3-phosphate dehydrogenase [Candidatus Binatia bacterium]